MREILFRGKRVDNWEWVIGDFCQPCNIVTSEWGYDELLEKEDTIWNDYAVVPETVGQFTGLKDKNGKEIFEGDFVKVKGVIHCVDFLKGAFVIIPIANAYVHAYLYEYDKQSEIIGNIYDNPELMEECNE